MNIGKKVIIAVYNIEDELWDKELRIGSSTLLICEYLTDHDLHHFEQINGVIRTQSFM